MNQLQNQYAGFNNDEQDFQPYVPASRRWLVRGVIGVAVLLGLAAMNPLTVVGAGQRGVVVEFGKVSETVLGEGLHFRIPVMQSVLKMSVQVGKAEMDAAAATKDMQAVKGRLALNYHVDPAAANWVYQNLGMGYENRIVIPQTQEVVKAVTARYEASELLTKRTEVRDEVLRQLRERLAQYRLVVVDFSFVDFGFSQSFNQAVEDKQRADQVAQKAKFDLERVRVEAAQKVEMARAEAEAIRIQSEAVRAQGGESYVQLKAIEKWDGVLPQVSGSSTPFINLGNAGKAAPATAK